MAKKQFFIPQVEEETKKDEKDSREGNKYRRQRTPNMCTRIPTKREKQCKRM